MWWILAAVANGPVDAGRSETRRAPIARQVDLTCVVGRADVIVVGRKVASRSTASTVDAGRGSSFWSEFVVDEVLKGPASLSEGSVIQVGIRSSTMKDQPLIVFLKQTDDGVFRAASPTVALRGDPWGRLLVSMPESPGRVRVVEGHLVASEERMPELFGPGPVAPRPWAELVVLAQQHEVPAAQPGSTFTEAVEWVRAAVSTGG